MDQKWIWLGVGVLGLFLVLRLTSKSASAEEIALSSSVGLANAATANNAVLSQYLVQSASVNAQRAVAITDIHGKSLTQGFVQLMGATAAHQNALAETASVSVATAGAVRMAGFRRDTDLAAIETTLSLGKQKLDNELVLINMQPELMRIGADVSKHISDNQVKQVQESASVARRALQVQSEYIEKQYQIARNVTQNNELQSWLNFGTTLHGQSSETVSSVAGGFFGAVGNIFGGMFSGGAGGGGGGGGIGGIGMGMI